MSIRRTYTLALPKIQSWKELVKLLLINENISITIKTEYLNDLKLNYDQFLLNDFIFL